MKSILDTDWTRLQDNEDLASCNQLLVIVIKFYKESEAIHAAKNIITQNKIRLAWLNHYVPENMGYSYNVYIACLFDTEKCSRDEIF